MMRHGDNHKRLQKPAGDLHSCLAKTKCTQKQKNLTFVSLSTGMQWWSMEEKKMSTGTLQ